MSRRQLRSKTRRPRPPSAGAGPADQSPPRGGGVGDGIPPCDEEAMDSGAFWAAPETNLEIVASQIDRGVAGDDDGHLRRELEKTRWELEAAQIKRRELEAVQTNARRKLEVMKIEEYLKKAHDRGPPPPPAVASEEFVGDCDCDDCDDSQEEEEFFECCVAEDEDTLTIPVHIRNGPRMTDERARLEMAALTDEERVKALMDVVGRRRRRRPTDPLEEVEEALASIPVKEKRALLRAQRAFPFLLAEPRRVQPFLAAEDEDPRRAAWRLVRYWRDRERALGSAAFVPEAFGTPTEEAYVRMDRWAAAAGNSAPAWWDADSTAQASAVRAAAEERMGSWRRDKFDALEAEIDAMSPRVKAAFLESSGCMPEQVLGDTQKLMFLRSEDFDARRAAQRLVGYWDIKSYLFGRANLLRVVTLEELEEECREELDAGIVYLLPDADERGRKVVLLRCDKVPADRDAHIRILKILWFIFHVLLVDKNALSNGIVSISYLGSFKPRNWSFEISTRLMQLMICSMPLKLKAIHSCQPPAARWFATVIWPWARHVMGKRYRLRSSIHYGNDDEVLASLEEAGMRKEQLPGILGGNLDDEYPRVWFEGLEKWRY